MTGKAQARNDVGALLGQGPPFPSPALGQATTSSFQSRRVIYHTMCRLLECLRFRLFWRYT
jgi:hypothetical protein